MNSRVVNARFAFFWAVIALLLLGAAATRSVFAAWPAVTSGLLAAGYSGVLTNVCGKRRDGKLRPLNVILLLPYLLPYWVAWHLRRVFDGEDRFHEVSPGLFVGRRLLANEFPDEIELVVDLTSEFVEPRRIRTACDYLCLPVLDGGAVPLVDLLSTTSSVAAREGPVLIHCAQGHGRSVMLAVAVLIARGAADDVSEALTMIQLHRPGASLRREQRRLLGLASSHLKLESPDGGRIATSVCPPREDG